MRNSFLILLSIIIAHNVQSQIVNSFGVGFSPYVKNAPFPNWDTYTLEENKDMLRIILTKHNEVASYSMGVAGYNEGKPWDQCDSNALIARAAAQVNRDHASKVLTVSQGIYQNDDPNLLSREINNAFLAAEDANNIWPGTVWGLIFTNEWVTDGNNGPRVLQMIRDNKNRAHQMGLKVGARVHTCGEIHGGPNQGILQQIAQESDFIMCNLYPPFGANDPARAVQQIGDAFFGVQNVFKQHNSQIEVIIGETGWAHKERRLTVRRTLLKMKDSFGKE